MVLLLDNFDSFTYNLADYLRQAGAECVVLNNQVSPEQLSELNLKGIVLSPGPETPAKAGRLLQVLGTFYNKLPILGICLGHQAIGQFFGAALEKAHKPMHGKISMINCEEDYLFNGLARQLKVVRYHSLVLNSLPEALSSIAATDSGEIMAIKHKHLPIRGVQFHPEAILTESGLAMLKNWLRFNNIVDEDI
ncbi:anthranilate synthase component II [Nafulsella turpanensis]|uniref:anthranilate synthase component II n=1 Tax=Nafulsella turpanensis TaxID=1265690 RepID=UPI0003492EEC|nr:aminodeoxychorismate/anthranilate synthase component II [Nafulsella turpanensis]